MLKTFLIWGFVLFPLAAAVIWIMYRARFFILGLVVITAGVAAIWGMIRLSDNLTQANDPVADVLTQPILYHSGTEPAPAPLPGRI